MKERNTVSRVVFAATRAAACVAINSNPVSEFALQFRSELAKAAQDEQEARLVDLARRIEAGGDAPGMDAIKDDRDALHLVRRVLLEADHRKTWAYGALIKALTSRRIHRRWRIPFVRVCEDLFHEELVALAFEYDRISARKRSRGATVHPLMKRIPTLGPSMLPFPHVGTWALRSAR